MLSTCMDSHIWFTTPNNLSGFGKPDFGFPAFTNGWNGLLGGVLQLVFLINADV